MRHTGLTVKAIRRAVEHGDLSRLGGPGEVEWWFWEGDESRLAIDNPARLAWHLAVRERARIRRALHALDFDLIESGPATYEPGKVMCSLTQTWVGPAGTVTVQWNADPTDPTQLSG